MSNLLNLVELIKNLNNSENTISYINKEALVTRTYKETLYDALNFLKVINSYNIKKGCYVALINSDMQGFVTVFWALVLGGYVPVVLPAIFDYNETDSGFKKLKAIVKKLNIQLVIGDLDSTKIKNIEALKHISICSFNHFSSKLDLSDFNLIFKNTKSDDVALVMLTSGSTGEPKIVPLTHKNLLNALSSKSKFYLLNSVHDVSMNFLPLDHVAGVIEFHLLQCYNKCSQIHVAKEYVLADTNNFLNLIYRNKVTMSMAPNFFIELINKNLDTKLELDLSSLRILVCAGDFVVKSTITQFCRNLAEKYKLNKNCVMPAFGMTETCAGITYSDHWDLVEELEFLNLGKPIQDAQIQIKNIDGTVAEEGEVGELEVKGPMVIEKYYDSKDNIGVFSNGWMKTGDMGYIKNGILYLTGRFKHVIVVNGINYTCQEIELLINENVSEISRDNVAVTSVKILDNPEKFVVLFISSNNVYNNNGIEYETIQKVKKLCLKYLGTPPYLVLPVKAEVFLRTSIGKIDRAKIKSDFETGKLSNYIEYAKNLEKMSRKYIPPKNSTEESLADIFSDLFSYDRDQISLEDRFLDLGGTSIMSIKLQQRILDVYGVDLPITSIVQNPSLKEICSEIVDQKSLNGKQKIIPYNPIVKLNSSGSKKPVFFVHPGVGDVLVFIELAKKFNGDRPFYALRARGFNLGEEFFTSYDEIIDSYTSAIKNIQPEPPYYIAGYSYGACIAYGVSHKLQKTGDDVAFTGIINLPPYIKERMEELDVLENLLHLSMFVKICKKEDIPKIREIIKDLPFEDQIEYMLKGDDQVQKRIRELNIDKEKLKQWTLLSKSLIDIGKTFMPYTENRVKKLHIFHAIALFDTKEVWLKKLKEWDKYAVQKNEYYEVPGEHYTMMDQEHVNGFYEVFSKVLDKCDQDYSLISKLEHLKRNNKLDDQYIRYF